MRSRGNFVVWNDLAQAAPAPRVSRTPGRLRDSADGLARLREWGVDL